jgi:hemoglobin
MKPDIASRNDIDSLMARFYDRAMSDPEIGYFFTEVAKLDLTHHLPVIGDFWESNLFGTGVYAKHRRNPLAVHAELARKSPLQAHHFQRWLKLFTECVDESFAGVRAEFLKQRGQAIAGRMLDFLAAPD